MAAILYFPKTYKNTPLKRSPGEGLQSLIALFLGFICRHRGSGGKVSENSQCKCVSCSATRLWWQRVLQVSCGDNLYFCTVHVPREWEAPKPTFTNQGGRWRGGEEGGQGEGGEEVGVGTLHCPALLGTPVSV